MRQIKKILVLLLLTAAASGCAEGKTGMESLKETEKSAVSELLAKNEGGEERDEEKNGGVDFDLTSMSGDMVYATVYSMMAEPENYVGKVIRMKGLYYAGYGRKTGKYRHYCLIQDALACCTQGLEFVWGDGSRLYPDEYPEENSEIIVCGIYESYQNEGDSGTFYRLKNAEVELESTEPVR